MTTKKDWALLGVIVASMANAAAPFTFASTAEVKNLAKDGFVEQNADLKDGEKLATRATDAGVTAFNEFKAKADQPKPTAPAPVIVASASGFEPPVSTPRVRSDTYGLDTLEIGGIVFVAKSEAMSDPVAALRSTVNTAMKRFDVEIAGKTRSTRKGATVPFTVHTRQFGIVAVEGGKVYGTYTAPGDGAVIYRSADYIPTDADKALPAAPAATA